MCSYIGQKFRDNKKKALESKSNLIGFNSRKREMLYTILLDDLRFLKTLQWNIVYYCLLIYGGIIALKLSINSLDVWHIIILLIISLSVFLVGIYYIIEIQVRQTLNRIGIKNHRDIHLMAISQFGIDEKQTEKDIRFFRDTFVFFTFIGTNLVALVITLYLILDGIPFDRFRF